MTVSVPEGATYACVGALMDELARSGVRHVCVCPGSRSTPLALSAARHPALRVWTFVDERSAGFFALGMAKALRAPVAVLATSGTAAANFLPAVVEARYGRVPLLVLTADRPRRLRDCAAPQTITQAGLYGPHVKWCVDVADPLPTADGLRYFRTIACQAAAAAREHPRGAVHLNVPLDEPLVPTPAAADGVGPPADTSSAWEGRSGGRPYAEVRVAPRVPDQASARGLAADLSRATRGVIVCGPHDDPRLGGALARLASAFGCPILADPLSQVRCGPHDRRLVIDAYDAVLRVEDVAERLAPDTIVRVGGVPASKPLLRYLERHADARQIVVDAGDGWTDPARLASDVIRADPRLLCEAIVEAWRPPAGAPPCEDGAGSAAAGPRSSERRPGSPWTHAWTRLNAVARAAIRSHLAGLDEPFEGKVFDELARLLPDGATLYAGNSMPVRDLDTFFAGTARAVRVLGNRGASGIDGLVSSALGAAAAGPAPVVLVLGDLAFYHDLNGLLAARLHRLRAMIVLLNNDGGGIFSFLPQAAYPEHFETLFGTPTGLDFSAAARLYDAAWVRAETWPAFRAAFEAHLASPGVSVVEMRTSRDRNVVLHRDVWTAVEAAVLGARLAEAAATVRPGRSRRRGPGR